MRYIKFLVVLLFLISQPALATIYYVTESGAGTGLGNDIGNAASLADFEDGASGSFDSSDLDGDTVCFGGALNEIDLSGADEVGSNGSLITIDGSGTGDCTDADAAVVTVSDSDIGIKLDTPSYIVVKGFTVQNSAGQDSYGIRAYDTSGTTCEYVYIQNNTVNLYSSGTGSTCNVNASCGIDIKGDYRNIELSGNVVTGMSWGMYSGIKIKTGSDTDELADITLSNNTTSDVSHSSMSIANQNNGATITGIDIDTNTCNNYNRAYGRCFEVTNAGTIPNVSEMWVHDNTFKYQRAQVQFDEVKYLSFYRNKISFGRNVCGPAVPTDYDATHTGEDPYYGDTLCQEPCVIDDGCSESDGFGNAVANGKAHAIDIWGGASSDGVIFQNTFYNHAEASVQLSTNVTNFYFTGNIQAEDALYAIGTWSANGPLADNHYDNDAGDTNPPGSNSDYVDCSFSFFDWDGHTGSEIRNNVFYTSGVSDIFCDKGDSAFKTLAEAEDQFDSGDDRGVVIDDNANSNPLMVDPDNQDFTLQSASPAKDRGFWTTISTVTSTTDTVQVGNALFLGAPGEIIKTEAGVTGTISSINYTTNTLTLTGAISVINGEGIGLLYYGASLDAGAEEYYVGMQISSGSLSISSGSLSVH